MLKSGGGMPYINNDDVVVQAYVDLGVPLEDARSYANSNCWETMIAGSSDQELIRGMNFLLCLELALNRGVARVSGRREGPDTGDPLQFDTFEALLNAWKVQLDDLLRQGIEYIAQGVECGNLEHSNHGRYCFSPLLSCLTRDCIKNGQDAIRGGARYTIWHVMGEAVANAADALAAIKKMVFEDRDMSLDELLAVLQSDWDGYDLLRQRFITRFPKWGNDRDYVDSIARTLMEWFGERSAYHAAGHPNIIFPTSIGTFSWYAMIGKEVSATSDGRQSGDPIAANFSPVVGRDLQGPTAALNSYLKMPLAD
ncbi:MAG: pyruvate formate lyase family protein, partial [SAR202 cluster bacterium]|nr:pyruvate formate lyase family protein [SAR202 cluster bacterium]